MNRAQIVQVIKDRLEELKVSISKVNAEVNQYKPDTVEGKMLWIKIQELTHRQQELEELLEAIK